MPRGLATKTVGLINAAADWPAWERSGQAEAAEQESLATVVQTWRRTKFGQASE